MELAVNFKSRIASSVMEDSASNAVETNEGGAVPAAYDTIQRKLNIQGMTYHLLFGKIVRNIDHSLSILAPLACCLHEAHARQKLRKAPQNGEEVDYERPRDRRGVEVPVRMFDQVDEGVVALLDLISIGKTKDNSTGKPEPNFKRSQSARKQRRTFGDDS